jgi:predicted transcriptional regulator
MLQPLADNVRLNIALIMSTLEISQMQLQEYLPLAQSAISRRVRGEKQWQLNEVQRICDLINMPTCSVTASAPDGLRDELAARNAAYRAALATSGNRLDRAGQKRLLANLYSAEFADMALA